MSTIERVRAALGEKFDPKADYTVVRPGMTALPKFARHERVGEFIEDGRDGGTLIVLRRPAPPPKPVAPPPLPVSRPAVAAEKVRSYLSGSRPTKK